MNHSTTYHQWFVFSTVIHHVHSQAACNHTSALTGRGTHLTNLANCPSRLAVSKIKKNNMPHMNVQLSGQGALGCPAMN